MLVRCSCGRRTTQYSGPNEITFPIVAGVRFEEDTSTQLTVRSQFVLLLQGTMAEPSGLRCDVATSLIDVRSIVKAARPNVASSTVSRLYQDVVRRPEIAQQLQTFKVNGAGRPVAAVLTQTALLITAAVPGAKDAEREAAATAIFSTFNKFTSEQVVDLIKVWKQGKHDELQAVFGARDLRYGSTTGDHAASKPAVAAHDIASDEDEDAAAPGLINCGIRDDMRQQLTEMKTTMDELLKSHTDLVPRICDEIVKVLVPRICDEITRVLVPRMSEEMVTVLAPRISEEVAAQLPHRICEEMMIVQNPRIMEEVLALLLPCLSGVVAADDSQATRAFKKSKC